MIILIIGFQFALYQNRFDHLLLDCLLENKPVVDKYDNFIFSDKRHRCA